MKRTIKMVGIASIWLVFGMITFVMVMACTEVAIDRFSNDHMAQELIKDETGTQAADIENEEPKEEKTYITADYKKLDQKRSEMNVEELTPIENHIEALYFDYLVIETADGKEYLLDEAGDWFEEDGKVKFNDGEAYTAVIENSNVVALY